MRKLTEEKKIGVSGTDAHLHGPQPACSSREQLCRDPGEAIENKNFSTHREMET